MFSPKLNPIAKTLHDSDFSPSASGRWLACPGSVVLCHGLADKPSVHAEEGTKAHKCCEIQLCLAYKGVSDVYDFEPTEEMFAGAGVWIDVLRERFDAGADEWHVEYTIDLSAVLNRPGAKGTADFWAVHGDTLIVADYKFGKGVRVDATENTQLLLYAAGLIRELSARGITVKTVRLIIVQPRIQHIDSWECTWNHAVEFGLKCRAAVTLGQQLLAHPDDALTCLHPGDKQCRFCKAFAHCPACRQLALEKSRVEDFHDLDALPVPSEPEQIAKALGYIGLIEKWCEAVRTAATGRMADGLEVPGYKLVAGRDGPRKWAAGAEQAIRHMRIRGDKLYEKKFISPTKAQALADKGLIKASQWQRMQSFITRSEGKPSIAPEADKRPALQFKGDFTNLDD